mmetsp:Transcript_5494/g.11360  ORF Transcript_5494/g.11360 Transcript_5494/m.11360 type:complete len:95 (+) Transcript_5494:669-953(+)
MTFPASPSGNAAAAKIQISINAGADLVTWEGGVLEYLPVPSIQRIKPSVVHFYFGARETVVGDHLYYTGAAACLCRRTTDAATVTVTNNCGTKI